MHNIRNWCSYYIFMQRNLVLLIIRLEQLNKKGFTYHPYLCFYRFVSIVFCLLDGVGIYRSDNFAFILKEMETVEKKIFLIKRWMQFQISFIACYSWILCRLIFIFHYSHAKIVIIQGRVRGEIFYPFFTFKLLLFWRFEYKFKYLTIITIKYMDYLVG